MSQQPFGDIPLFRELQRLLSSGGGPVNNEIARQIAASMAVDGSLEAPLDPQVSKNYAEAVVSSQQLLSGFTRLMAPDYATAEVITRVEWIDRTLQGWTWLFEVFADRFRAMMKEHAPEGTGNIEAALGQVAPLLMGFQVGSLLGALAREALFRHETPVPRDDDGKLFIVAPNVKVLADDYGLDRDDLIVWLALRDTGRQLVLSAHPWVDRYFRSLLVEIVSSVEIDISDIERKLLDLQSGEMASLEGLQEGLPVVETPRHQAALKRLQAFFALLEGYAALAAGEVAAEVIPTASKIEEGVTRHNTSPRSGRQALASMLGISLERSTTEAGETFCRAIVSLKGIQALNQVWAAADNLPSMDEIKDPFAWMERVLDA